MRGINGVHKKPPARVRLAPSSKILVSREEAAQLLSISVRGIDYLLATRRLPFRKIGGRVLTNSGGWAAKVCTRRSSWADRGL